MRFGSAVWSAGRLSTYATLGAVAGATGAAIPGPPWVSATVTSVLLVWFAGRLAGVFPELGPHLPAPLRVARAAIARKNLAARYVFGLATGLLPCGLVYAALLLAVAAAHPLDGALTMVAFGVGTLPALLLLTEGVRGVVNRTVWGRRVVALGVLIAGLWSVNIRSTDALVHSVRASVTSEP